MNNPIHLSNPKCVNKKGRLDDNLLTNNRIFGISNDHHYQNSIH